LGAFRRFASLLSPACLLAGLVLCPGLRADEPPPGRSVIPASALNLGPQLEQLEQRLKRTGDDLDSRLDAQALALSRNARAVDALREDQAGHNAALSRVQNALNNLDPRLADLDTRVKALDAAQARAATEAAAADSRAIGWGKDLVQLRKDLQASQDSLETGLKEVAAARSELKERGEKLAGLTDLLGAMKRELNANNEELVELRLALKRAPAPAPESLSGGSWWEQALRWKYLPAVAVGLSAAALGVAAAR
jgi:DNA repair exonuclease SbcCD ATPase subunit